ncbi:MAG: preQ(1) synthase [Verrucomicrobiae bacterium]|nr:preQ(1) synthase [Verrucomicrobiae bacterium]
MKRRKYAGLSLLGRSETSLPGSPSHARLETFPNRNRSRDYWVRFECADFTSLCPVTGQPDFGRISIEYIPDESCLESKALKFYLASYRNERRFNEEIANRILDDLVAACHPRRLIVKAEFAPRGGIGISISAEHPSEGAGGSAVFPRQSPPP